MSGMKSGMQLEKPSRYRPHHKLRLISSFTFRLVGQYQDADYAPTKNSQGYYWQSSEARAEIKQATWYC